MPSAEARALERCRLCGEPALLQYSHIIPRGWYRRMQHGSPGGIVQVEGETAALSPKQHAEYMLCRDCEARFGQREHYFSQVAYQNDGSFPAYDAVLERPLVLDGDSRVGDASALNCADLAYLGASIIWRASRSTLYPDVCLGEEYERQFGEYLLDRAPFPAAALLLLELMRSDSAPNLPTIERLIVPPESGRFEPCRRHSFVAAGIDFRLYVGRSLPQAYAALSFIQHQRVLLTRGQRLIHTVARRVQRADPRGRLAKLQTA